MLQPIPLSRVDCLVIWQPSRDWPEQPRWWALAKRWFAPGYGHVLVLFYDPDGDAWCVIDPVFGGIQARALSARAFTVQAILREYPGTAWRLVVRDRSEFPPVVRGPVTCVSVVKAVLGLKGWTWTPWQLLQQIDAFEGAEEAAGPDGRRDPGPAGPGSGDRQGQG